MGKELIQLASGESSFFNHIITAERPPGFSLGAVQGSVKAEAELCLGSERRRMSGKLTVSRSGPRADTLESSICVARPALPTCSK